MGQFVSRTWFIYGRDSEDEWYVIKSTLVKEDDYKYHMGRFKHVFFEMALERIDTRKIYLYRGWRMVKCEKTSDRIHITFQNKQVVKAWNECKRSHLGKIFDKKWQLSDDNTYTKVFKPLVID